MPLRRIWALWEGVYRQPPPADLIVNHPAKKSLYPSLSTGSRWISGTVEKGKGIATHTTLTGDYPMHLNSPSPTATVTTSPGFHLAGHSNITTWKRYRDEGNHTPVLQYKHNDEFTMDSPRPLKRHLPSLEDLKLSSPWDLIPPPK